MVRLRCRVLLAGNRPMNTSNSNNYKPLAPPFLRRKLLSHPHFQYALITMPKKRLIPNFTPDFLADHPRLYKPTDGTSRTLSLHHPLNPLHRYPRRQTRKEDLPVCHGAARRPRFHVLFPKRPMRAASLARQSRRHYPLCTETTTMRTRTKCTCCDWKSTTLLKKSGWDSLSKYDHTVGVWTYDSFALAVPFLVFSHSRVLFFFPLDIIIQAFEAG